MWVVLLIAGLVLILVQTLAHVAPFLLVAGIILSAVGFVGALVTGSFGGRFRR